MPKRYSEEFHTTSNPTVWRKLYYFRVLGCDICPPNRGENMTGRYPRHDRYKSARKGRCLGPIEPPCREIALFYTKRCQRPGAPSHRYMKKCPRWYDKYE